MSIELYFRSLVLGFAIAAPVGPIGILCIQRTLRNGRVYGLVSGLGAATADAVYGVIAALGLSVLSQWLTAQSRPLGIVGGLLLLYLGVQAFRAAPAVDQNDLPPAALLSAYGSVVLLTITNPMTILSFAVIFGGMAANVTPSTTTLLVMPLGVFTGSALWWLTLSGGVSLLRRRLRPQHLRRINQLAGLLLCGFGVVLLLSTLKI
ncbi:MAG: LysE family transporter [Caldilineaceae bacterium]